MADLNFLGPEEEHAELKKLNAEVVSRSSLRSIHVTDFACPS